MKKRTTRVFTLMMAACLTANPSLSALAQGTSEAVTGLESEAETEALETKSTENDVETEALETKDIECIAETEYLETKSLESEVETEALETESIENKVETEALETKGLELEENNENISLLSLEINNTRYEDGVYDFNIESGYKMFKIDAASKTATIKGNEVKVSFKTTNNYYDRFFFGNKDEAETITEDKVIFGTKLENTDGYLFTFTLSTSKMGQTLNFVPGKPDSKWYEGEQKTLKIPMAFTEPELTYKEGDYTIAIESGYKMFKIDPDSQTAKVDGGKITVSFKTTTNTYDRFFFGDKDEADNIANENVIYGTKLENREGYLFTFTLSTSKMGQTLNFVPGKPDSKWYEGEQKTLKIPEKLTEVQTPDETPEKPSTPEETPDKKDDVVANGMYKVNVESSAAMFKVVDAVLVAKDGQYSATITLSGKSYSYLYMGTSAQAEKAATSEWISYTEDASGRYTYTIPVNALDTPIDVAAYSKNKNQWYDRTLTFVSEGMTSIKGDGETTPDTPSETTPETKPDTKPDNESKYESDTSGSTSRVNNSTTLADGVYTPDQFSWSGGSGRASLSCSKVTVENGQAYATLVFNSENYAYVKANGNTYYGTKGGGVTSFVIPVELNANNRIIGMTTAMSASHEVEYQIYIYIAAAAGSTKPIEKLSENTLSEEAPELVGLEFVSETELRYAELFKIFNYKDGITLLEVDISKYTAELETDKDETSKSETDEESLYQKNIVRYLIVPEDVEVPVGIDETMIIVQQPIEHTYIASENAFESMEALELLEIISTVGFEEDEEYSFAGKYFEPDYKKLVKEKTDLAILPGSLLPAKTDASGEKLTKEEQKERLTTITERMETLNIPVIFDRSLDEKEKLAKEEWIKFYGALFGQQEKAAELFEAVEKSEK